MQNTDKDNKTANDNDAKKEEKVNLGRLFSKTLFVVSFYL
jgi:hypothetical protein